MGRCEDGRGHGVRLGRQEGKAKYALSILPSETPTPRASNLNRNPTIEEGGSRSRVEHSEVRGGGECEIETKTDCMVHVGAVLRMSERPPPTDPQRDNGRRAPPSESIFLHHWYVSPSAQMRYEPGHLLPPPLAADIPASSRCHDGSEEQGKRRPRASTSTRSRSTPPARTAPPLPPMHVHCHQTPTPCTRTTRTREARTHRNEEHRPRAAGDNNGPRWFSAPSTGRGENSADGAVRGDVDGDAGDVGGRPHAQRGNDKCPRWCSTLSTGRGENPADGAPGARCAGTRCCGTRGVVDGEGRESGSWRDVDVGVGRWRYGR
ncbi:hypothetical protein C8J57DRAFT_1720479 [Mycena rebaudengoi]|nr:hypothetical protein C8J57DRAFT_1720479 [Mycena rebaudengoi]